MDSDDELPFHAEASPHRLLPRSSPSAIESLRAVSRSLSQRRASSIDIDHDYPSPRPIPQPISTGAPRISRSKNNVSQLHPRPLPTPKRSAPPHSLLPSAPASPPTPAPSPTPHQRAPSWTSAGEDEDSFLRDSRGHFSMLNNAARQRYLAELLNMCDSQLLSFVHHFVSPRLKKDPFAHLPNELCLRVCRNLRRLCSWLNAVYRSFRS